MLWAVSFTASLTGGKEGSANEKVIEGGQREEQLQMSADMKTAIAGKEATEKKSGQDV